ncbi:MAG: glycosyltransferase family 4 protein [Anaerolineae bacterium]|nr:glycosyltransferase family 4 protein [Anaerolineae bacterium]
MRICLVSPGLDEGNRRLQPWCYLFQLTHALLQDGHSVSLISDGGRSRPSNGTVGGLPVIRVGTLRGQHWCRNSGALRAVAEQGPDAVLWHLGLTSFVHLGSLRYLTCRSVGVFTSPIYRPGELLRLGIFRLLRGYRLSAAHLAGLVIPPERMRRALDRGEIQKLVVECETTHSRLVERGIPAERIAILRPGIDGIWLRAAPSPAERDRKRQELGLSRDDFVVGFFGPPAVLRGLPTLLRALALLQSFEPTISGLVLSRQREGEVTADALAVGRLVRQLGIGHRARLVSGLLAQDELRHAVAACDAIALPFEVVPSDVPLSVLEAMAMGLPLITTDVACLPELVPDGAGLRIPPARPDLLAEAIGRLAKDVALRKRLGAAAQQRATRWQWSRRDGPKWTSFLEG